MSTTTPPSPPQRLAALPCHTSNKLRNYTPIQSFNRKDFSIRCEFENSQRWTVGCVSGTDPIHIILKPPSIPMTSAAVLGSSGKNSKRVCLFYCNEMKDLAERIASQSDAIELRNITWRTFEDGFPNLFISNAHGIRGQHVAFLASFNSPGVIFEQLSVIYALPKLFVSSFTLVLPFFPTGTSERMEDEGVHQIRVSAKKERFYFGDNILPCFESGIPLLLNRLQQLPDSDNISIAFPDDGAWKRFHKQLQHFPMIVCAKVREGDQRIVRIKEGDPAGRHVVIVDDLVQSGGTLTECQKVLAKHGAQKISAYVTHGIFPNRSWQRFSHDKGGSPENGMTYFWITDSCPQTVKEVKDKKPFEVLSLAAPIAAALQI
ncbi:ribose-phosphate pyrophosphokinase 4-like isoform X3 [Solanum pennellii]|uniref:Ribose-phosphate pyrophosphokinase 4-like isoform X3 n=1 Tax=Solanum pennellii TaxID=28526 RepID=A0ABM1V9D3_SOLPN|nr:ribose-phosphate pyrophosphokinase 4-like isoform X3 [Solanum pennellii]